MIFVFGSNLSGIHSAGAAKYAYEKLGAIWGIGEGLTGKCYAIPIKGRKIPTKGRQIEHIPLSLVSQAIERFLQTARYFDKDKFKVTQIGCDLGGFTKEQIAPFFQDAPDNCYFDTKWKDILGEEKNYWGTF